MADDRPLGRRVEPAGSPDRNSESPFSDREVPLRTVGRSDAEPTWFATPTGTAVSLEVLLASPLLPLPRVIAVLRAVARQLDGLAAAGRVYGAVSPSTIAVDTDGRATLLPPEEVDALRPGYLAPEQRHGDQPDARLDQYALAIVAYELLTGERREARLEDGPALDVVNEIRVGPEHPLRPGVGPTVNEVIRRGMARDPAWRFATATEFVDALATQLEVPPPVVTADEAVLDRVAAARMARASRATGPGGPSPASRFLGLLTYGLVAVGAVVGLTMLALDLTGRSAGSLLGRPDRPPLVESVAGGGGGGGGGGGNAAAGGAAGTATGTAAAAAATQGFLSIQTDGGTATILLDGRAAGTAPTTISVTPGIHTIALQATGRAYAPAIRTVRVAAGDTASASFSGQ